MGHPVPRPDAADAPAGVPLAPAPPPVPSPHEAARRFVGALVVFLALFLVVRTAALEPFGVPTGSMAGALLGNRREAPCPRCDHPVVVGEPGPDARPVDFARCRCPNCFEPVDLTAAREVPGDRLMVDKTAYQPRPPRRWEVAVFRCPADLSKPYVKRVVGLPGEHVRIHDGDAFADGGLLRKTLAQVRETRVPVLDMGYSPAGGWAPRWVVEPVAGAGKPATAGGPPDAPADESVLRDDGLYLDGRARPVGVTYRHRNLDTQADEPVTDWLAYNGGPTDRRGGFARRAEVGEPAHDFAVEFDLEVVAGAGTFACRLGDGADTVRADVRVGDRPGPDPTLVAHDGGPLVGLSAAPPLAAGRTYRVEFAFVDRRASLAVDGKEVVPPVDLPAGPPGGAKRKGVARPVQLGAGGAAVAVRNLRLFRDIHYLPLGPQAGAGWRLGPDEYFLLGDNTANSHDSRLWAADGRPAPGVPAGDFVGKPFLIHQPLRVGRVAVNGRARAFQTLDLARVRWLR